MPIRISPVEALMQESGAAMTRDEYIKFNNLGKSAKVSPEEEAELPKRFQYPIVTHEELPQEAEGKGTQAKAKPKEAAKPAHLPGGAPVDFSGPVLPNPKGIEPMLDTERPAGESNKYVRMNNLPYYEGDYGMDISNPPKSDLVEDESTPEPVVPYRPLSKTPVVREQ